MRFFAICSWSYFEASDLEVIAHLADLQTIKQCFSIGIKCTNPRWNPIHLEVEPIEHETEMEAITSTPLTSHLTHPQLYIYSSENNDHQHPLLFIFDHK